MNRPKTYAAKHVESGGKEGDKRGIRVEGEPQAVKTTKISGIGLRGRVACRKNEEQVK
jgi:hypothetical protein